MLLVNQSEGSNSPIPAPQAVQQPLAPQQEDVRVKVGHCTYFTLGINNLLLTY